MRGKVAVITGGGAGIGKASSMRFAKEGAKVIVMDLDKSDGQSTAQLICESGGQAAFFHGSVASEADCQACAQMALDTYGRIDVLVANAGVRVFGDLLQATEEDWDLVLNVNLKGVAYSCKAVLPHMVEQQSGAIVIVSSANALVGRARMPLYDATKAAVLSLTRSLAAAYGQHGIRVNSICPGYTVTDYHERRAEKRGISPAELRERSSGYGLLGTPAEPRQLASAIYFMASEDASNVTGQYLMVDGGLSVPAATR